MTTTVKNMNQDENSSQTGEEYDEGTPDYDGVDEED